MRDHALGKARSVAGEAGERPVLGVDTTVALDGRIYAKPTDAGDAERMLEELSGRTHAVVSGLALVTPGWEHVEDAATLVTFRTLTPRDLGAVRRDAASGRDAPAATRSRAAAPSLVERVEGDYLNVVGLPASLLVRLLAEQVPGHVRLRIDEKPRHGPRLLPQSGCPDSNWGPLRPERSALPGCATPRGDARVAEPQMWRCTTAVQESST